MFEFPDINIPIVAFLIVFGAYMTFYVIYSLFNIYHLIRYGVYGFGLYLIVTVFTCGTVILVGASVYLLIEYDWMTPIGLYDAVEYYNEDLFPGL